MQLKTKLFSMLSCEESYYKEKTMKCTINIENCDGCGNCVNLYPETFRIRIGLQEGDNKAELIEENIIEPECREAAELCPTGAIIIQE